MEIGDYLVKIRNILIIAILILAVAAGTSFIFADQFKNVEITVETNGSYVQIQADSLLFFTVPESMKSEMQKVALNAIADDESTVDSIKQDMKKIAQSYNYNITVKVESQFGTDQLPMTATVKGRSMVPTLQDGQDVVLLKTKDIELDDMVVARHPTYGLIVKRVKQINGDQVFLWSDNREVVISGNLISRGLDTWVSIDDIVGVVKEY